MTDSTPTPPASDAQTSRLDRLQQIDDRLLWTASVLLVLALGIWLAFTPPGVLGKADAVGYAICHRITARSFLFPSGRQLPMCARDTGTFLSVLIGMFAPGLIFRHRRASRFPSLWLIAVMLLMTGWWAFDGTNSFMHLIPRDGLPRLYQPTNFLRILTGTMHGITMGSLILPIANSTLWADARDEPTIAHWWELAAMYGIGLLLMLAVLSGWAIFLYPLALLSAFGVIAILSAINMVMVATILRRDGEAHTLTEALPVILLGITVTVAMIGGIDALRYALFGTWGGFEFPTALLVRGLFV